MNAIWRAWAFIMWAAVAAAVTTVVVTVALVLVVGAVLMGALMPSRTIGGQLKALDANTRAAIAHISALDLR